MDNAKGELWRYYPATPFVTVASLLAQKHSENIRWERSWNIFMESFLNILWTLVLITDPHKHQGIFAEHLTSDYPLFDHHPEFMQTIF